MKTYSMDLRVRVLKDVDAGLTTVGGGREIHGEHGVGATAETASGGLGSDRTEAATSRIDSGRRHLCRANPRSSSAGSGCHT